MHSCWFPRRCAACCLSLQGRRCRWWLMWTWYSGTKVSLHLDNASRTQSHISCTGGSDVGEHRRLVRRHMRCWSWMQVVCFRAFCSCSWWLKCTWVFGSIWRTWTTHSTYISRVPYSCESVGTPLWNRRRSRAAAAWPVHPSMCRRATHAPIGWAPGVPDPQPDRWKCAEHHRGQPRVRL